MDSEDIIVPIDTVRSLMHDIHNFNINIDSREIYLHSFFGIDASDDYESGVDYRMSSVFIKNVNFLNSINNDNILVHLQTNGGDWYYGMGMYDSLLMSSSPTTVLVHSQSMSMGTVIMQSCDNRILMPNIEYMIHYGYAGAWSAKPTIYSVIDSYKRNDETMFNIYASRCVNGKFFSKKKYDKKQTISYIKKILKEKVDWHMDPQEAVDYGFADGIFGEKGFKDIDEIREIKKQRPFK